MNNFKKFVKERIFDYLPEEYKDSEVQFKTIKKLNKNYEGMMLFSGNGLNPVINLEEFYYDETLSDEEKVKRMAEVLCSTEIPSMDMSLFDDYERVKEKLFIRLSNAEMVEEDIPYYAIHDLVITYHVKVFDGGSVMIRNNMMDKFGVSKEQLHSDAMKNSEKLFPSSIMPMGNFFPTEDDKISIWIVTNRDKYYGAGALFYSGMEEKLYEMIGKYYVLPSSVHEVICVPYDKFDLETLKNMVYDINRSKVVDGEQLSDNIYCFDGEKLKMC